MIRKPLKIELPEVLHRSFKSVAAQNGLTMNELVVSMIEGYLHKSALASIDEAERAQDANSAERGTG